MIWTLLALLLAAGTAFAAEESICATSAVLMCENFEDRPLGNPGNPWSSGPGPKTPGWSMSDVGSLQVATDQAFDGTKALKFVYPQCDFLTDQDGDACGAGAFESGTNWGRTEIYMRQYVRFASNFTFGGKHFHHATTGASPAGSTRAPWFNIDGPNGGQGTPTGTLYADNEAFANVVYLQNQGANIAFGRDQWYCLETHTRRDGTGAVSLLEMWIDDVLRLRYTNVTFTNAVWINFYSTGFWNTFGTTGSPVTQSQCLASGQPGLSWTGTKCRKAASSKWMDSIVVSTARIGCLGGGGGGPTPPAAPTGLRFASLLLAAGAAIWLVRFTRWVS